MIRNMRIGVRSALAFGVLGVITFLLGMFSIVQLAKINDITDVLSLHRIPALSTATELRRDILRSQILITELSDAQNQQERDDVKRQMAAITTEYDESEKVMYSLARSTEAKEIVSSVASLHDAFAATLPQLYKLSDEQNIAEALAYRRNIVMPAAELLSAEVDKLGEFQLLRANQINDQATLTYTNSRSAVISGIVVTLIVLSALAFFYSRSVTQPLSYAVAVAKRVANGDLTEDISDHHNDEAADMLRALAAMQGQLRQTLTLISDSSQQLAATSEELSVVTNQSSQTMSQQSNQLEQAAAAVNQLTAAIEEVARSASSTSDNAEVADEKAQLGQAKINETIKIIEQLTTDIQHSANGVTTLAGNVKNIGSVLDVIRAIADQTNLLALNAAIEAARAGESGRGFAVVADEVRALAHRTQESTKEIEKMIQLVQSETDRAVTNMNNSNQRAESTLLMANDAGQAFNEITRLIGQISDQNVTVASAAEEQTSVAREVDKNLTYILDLSAQTAEGANQTSASSLDLSRLAEQLNNLVLKFKI
ncbi:MULTISPECIES: methyl-accepting chemotaxis protein [Marinomonas]|uniref:Methyl-accepting chemotaxis protein n=1 Tax=Marinomonas rhodophyticola TaxID=2992803 RepID=A0ABT3KK65_9GAMM|nr:methyl-accepting chemotaxis protein [Marinomonas sp. KJ51-3]MCW4630948.1 methyl-accepting chemotaxis protein [Marinomonas sp. KJ51-3]